MFVRYNGGHESHIWCSAPDELDVKVIYEVIDEKEIKGQNNYILKGVEGIFNSAWFTEVKPASLGSSTRIPEVGIPLVYRPIDPHTGFPKIFRENTTDLIIEVTEIGFHLYQVTTESAVYYLIVTGE